MKKTDTGEIIAGRWRLEVTEMRNIQQPTASRSCRLAREYRVDIKRNVNNEGAMLWQESRIN
jgi:hypothetical protein